MVQVRNKTGQVQAFNGDKLISSIEKSADLVNIEMPSFKNNRVLELVLDQIKDREVINAQELNNIIASILDEVDYTVAKSFRESNLSIK
jgi:hypothetical protein